jgi:hypothetical protein
MLIVVDRYTKQDLRNNPKIFYVFGDNEERIGNGGQAGACRDEPNAIGVATLSFRREWSDRMSDVWRQCRVIRRDFTPILQNLQVGNTVIWPADGVGTGIANLPEVSPRTFAYLQRLVNVMLEYRPT